MKPHRHLVDAALRHVKVPADMVAFIGDSITDVQVALSTGLRMIGFGKTVKRAAELDRAGAETLTMTMQDLALYVMRQRADAPGRVAEGSAAAWQPSVGKPALGVADV